MTQYKIVPSSKFNKSLKRIIKQNKDLTKLNTIVNILAKGEKLEEKYRDHKLINFESFKNCRECHIEPDWLLIYAYDDNILYLYLIDTGSHSQLFD